VVDIVYSICKEIKFPFDFLNIKTIIIIILILIIKIAARNTKTLYMNSYNVYGKMKRYQKTGVTELYVLFLRKAIEQNGQTTEEL